MRQERKYLDYQLVDNKQPQSNKGTLEEDSYCEADKECQRDGGDYRSLFMFWGMCHNIPVSDAPPPPSNVFSPMVCVMIAVTVWQGIKDVRCSV